MNPKDPNPNPESNPENDAQREAKILEILSQLIKITDEEKNRILECNKRSLRTMLEWGCQTPEDVAKLPKEIADFKTTGVYCLCSAVSKEQPISMMATGIQLLIESAFNFGKAQPKE